MVSSVNLKSVESSMNENDFCVNYRPLEGSYDEMCVKEGKIRPHWEYLIKSLQTLGRPELEKRCQEARRLMRDNGVSYNVFGDPQGLDRPWLLDPIPLLISSEEWGGIERGLAQRAELMQLLLKDLYGERRALRKGIIPFDLIAADENFLRACSNIEYSKQQVLPLYSVDLVRAADGQMWAIGDRTQAPAGAGYALENRLVLSRLLPSLFRDSHVHRLALFFRSMRTMLHAISPHEDPRIVVLTSGPNDETYFEHAYVAKYLGYTLVQGADLTVRDNKVCLKTLDGLQPVHVILRRMEDFMCDPLELNPDSYTGVAGLVQAVRQRTVSLANPLGTGLLENGGLIAFIDELAKFYLGEQLQIPSPKAWWCGEKPSCDYVLANMDKLLIKRISPIHAKKAVRGRLLSGKQRELLRDQILAQPRCFVGMEEINRSTAPVFINGQLVPRPITLRSFLVSSDRGFVVMPGGLTRVASDEDSAFLSTQTTEISKDTWVIASEPEKQVTLLTDTKQKIVVFESQGELPSRVAENLFWLGRYAERAEGTIRLLRAVLLSLTDPYDMYTSNDQPKDSLYTLLRTVTFLTETYPGFIGDETKLAAPDNELISIFLDKNRMGSLSATLQSLLNAARSVRERLSPDLWRVVIRIDEELAALQKQTSLQLGNIIVELDSLITYLAAFSGLSSENMTHEEGWRFLMIGRCLERAHSTSNLLRAMLSTVNPDEATILEHLLSVADSLMTYRRRYRSHLQVNAVLELLLQSELNPRAVGYNLRRLSDFIKDLHNEDEVPYRSVEGRLILEGLTQVRLSSVDTLAEEDSDKFRKDLDQLLVRLGRLLPNLSDAITNAYFSHAEQPRQLVNYGNEHEL